MSTQNAPLTTQSAATLAASPSSKATVFGNFANRFDLDVGKIQAIVTATIFRASKDEPPLTTEEVAAALIVCNTYNLNPFTKEIYAFRSKGKLLVVVGVDGWSTIVNRQAAFNGVEFQEHFNEQNGLIMAVTCKIHRKDRAMPTVVTEYTHECRRNTDPWDKMPIRMTRNRAFVQCARIAFSISGIVDDDEAQTFAGAPEALPPIIEGATRTETLKNVLQARNKRQPAQTVEGANGSVPKEDDTKAEREPGPSTSTSTSEAPKTVQTEATPEPAQEAPKSTEVW